MIYADANLLVYAAMETIQGEKCADYLHRNLSELCTSILTIDEVAWGIWRTGSPGKAIQFCGELLAGGIKLFEADLKTARFAIDAMRDHGLKPRDAFHAATMQLKGITTIVSEDRHFDKVPWIKRIWFK